MAFDDAPIVDKSAERSEESILDTLKAFSRKNGFISHEVNGSKDYGVDIICQLKFKNNALPFQFPIQVKSKVSYKESLINGETFKSFSFTSSRLGHLIRHTPYSGLIIIYDDNTQELYFETALALYTRVRESHTDDLWKEQDSVTLHIPITNVLNEKALDQIHSSALNSFYRNNQLLVDHSPSYDLPLASDALQTMSTVDFLLEYGETLFNSNSYGRLCNLLERLSRNSFQDKNICYLAAITYVEVGNMIDADYYFKLCERQISEYSLDKLEMLDLQRYKLEYYKGEKSRDELREMLKSINTTKTTSIRALSLKIDLLGLDLIDFIPDEYYDEVFIDSLEDTLTEIEESVQSETSRQYQLMYISDLLNRAVSGVLTSMLLNTKISETLGVSPVTQDRIEKKDRILYLNNKCQKYLANGLKYAEDNQDELMEASAKYYLSLASFSLWRSYHSADSKLKINNSLKEGLEIAYIHSIKAYNIFNKKNMRPIAYKAILLADEIFTLAKVWANFSLEHIVQQSQVKKVLGEFKGVDFRKFDGSLTEKTEGFLKEVKDASNRRN
ncbi:hypothetical protein AWW67_12750 [Roseivirga seohaensis]|uniref:DUF4365 domain-containing protein n=1 Tax=Roseivirga seohaensis TaxID=1914963 RepID=A0A150XKK4_9BACT|nr:DUF4365 domain-containing protein [Roseivirga seohaensis]KYG79243.1 hypothetical protein AWW67_12750 [Roseivirga seohaensis]